MTMINDNGQVMINLQWTMVNETLNSNNTRLRSDNRHYGEAKPGIQAERKFKDTNETHITHSQISPPS